MTPQPEGDWRLHLRSRTDREAFDCEPKEDDVRTTNRGQLARATVLGRAPIRK
jgi:hypothetical protein